ncbi:hypothetical protein [Tabrizicola sp. BL-A-41-H6]|uniref:hypothetical protein n=1 Tax=Tabrizicola sp. BL-A-41-H6 TaxID=3421107 RepID=UPI003D66590F
MVHPITLAATLTTATAALGACTQSAEVTDGRGQQEYGGVQTILLDDGLVSFNLAMTGAEDRADIEAYGRCAAAQYALDKGYGFARHVRTIVKKDGRTWYGDAVYMISATLPEGLRTIDAEVTAAECTELGIPTV